MILALGPQDDEGADDEGSVARSGSMNGQARLVGLSLDVTAADAPFVPLPLVAPRPELVLVLPEVLDHQRVAGTKDVNRLGGSSPRYLTVVLAR